MFLILWVSYVFVMAWIILSFIRELIISCLPCVRRFHYSKLLDLSNEIINRADQVANVGDYFFYSFTNVHAHQA